MVSLITQNKVANEMNDRHVNYPLLLTLAPLFYVDVDCVPTSISLLVHTNKYLQILSSSTTCQLAPQAQNMKTVIQIGRFSFVAALKHVVQRFIGWKPALDVHKGKEVATRCRLLCGLLNVCISLSHNHKV